jgi:Carboxypeptidase regulatory-like domain
MKKSILLNVLFFFCFFTTKEVAAQITGASFVGQVVNEKKESVVGATVYLQHVPTATLYAIVTDENGYFNFPDVKSGGPYTFKISSIGLENFEKFDIYLALGSKTTENITIKEQATVLDEVIIKYDKNRDKKGTSSNFAKTTIEKLPTLSNSIQDFTRLSAQANGNSFSGTNYRYNNLAIDGAVNNDAFGFVEPAVGAGGSQASGTPGSLARAQPISLDAIQELQVSVAPFDVTLGNFTGGSINAVTRSGTNKTSGSVYSFMKNQAITGRSADVNRTKIDNFSDYLTGASVGGALVKDKLFYFTNLEINRRTEPALFAAGTEGSAFKLEDIKRIADTVQNRYGYDIGSYGALPLGTQSLKFFARLDWNASPRDQISIRHNLVDAQADHLTRSANVFNFGSQGFTHFSTTNSTVFEWKRRISNRLFNKVIVSHAFIDEHRKTLGNEFPHVEITYGTAGTIFAGQYREAAIFRTRQRTFEFTDNLSYFYKNHHFTLGTHNEYYGINYHFVTPWNGRWAYSSIDNFFAEKPSRIRRTFNLTDNSYGNNYNNPSADYSVLLSSVYAQDDISLFNNKLSLTYGLRLDGSIFPTKPVANADITNTPEFSGFKEQLKNKFALAPRLGFNYKIDPENRFILRGGSGIFVGRMPFAWFTYPFLYDGNHYGNVDYRPAGKVVPLLSTVGELTTLQGNFQREVNLLDPNLRLPQVWRNNLGIDANLGKGWSVSVEGVFTKTIQDTKFETRNLKQTSVPLSTWDNRPYFSGEKVNPNFTSVFVVTNTSQGYRYNIASSIRKTTENWSTSVSYTYGRSKDLANGVRVSPQANWEWNQTLDPNNPRLSYSNFDIRHRVIGSTSWNFKLKENLPTTISLVYVAASGVPFSYIYSGDANRDGSPTNDLVYVPRNFDESGLVDVKNATGQVTLAATTQWDNLNNYIEKDNYLKSKRGNYVERNGARSPWNQQLDMRIMQQFVFKNQQRIQVSLDFINVSNLISKTWGRQYFVPNTTNAGYSLLTFIKVENNKPQYRFDNPTAAPYQYDPISSRTQGQLGIKYIF